MPMPGRQSAACHSDQGSTTATEHRPDAGRLLCSFRKPFVFPTTFLETLFDRGSRRSIDQAVQAAQLPAHGRRQPEDHRTRSTRVRPSPSPGDSGGNRIQYHHCRKARTIVLDPPSGQTQRTIRINEIRIGPASSRAL
jgi:hypothetical protein